MGKPKRDIVNRDTGEILQELKDGSRILPPKSIEKLQTTSIINENKSYIKVYDYTIERLLQEEGLSNSDIRVLFSIMPKVRYETGLIAYNNGSHVPLTSMPGICGLSEKTVYQSIENLVTKKILAKVRVGREIKLYANPFIFMRGVRANKTLVSMFSESKYAT